MDKNEFKAFCKKEFEARGFKKKKCFLFTRTGIGLLDKALARSMNLELTLSRCLCKMCI